jgi:hypothetical protein
MARRISHQLFAELEWENLLGLDKESREIKDLSARRNASHYLVLSDAYGLRVAGLLTAQTDAADAAGAANAAAYSLAAFLSLRAAGQPLLFVYALPVDPTIVDTTDVIDAVDAVEASASRDQVIVIAVNGGRPVLDRILPRAEALHEAALFAETLESAVRLVGNLAVDGLALSAMALPEAYAFTEEERAHCQIHALSGRRANNMVKNGAALLLLTGMVGTIAWLLWPAPTPHYETPVVTVDEQAAYYAALKDARKSISTGPGYAHITDIQQLLSELPIVVNGWRAKTLQCTAKTCNISWERVQGATLEGLLNGRPQAKIQEDDYDKAIESIPLLVHPESESGDSAKTRMVILPRLDFYEVANGRASTLKDHGMEAEIGIASPMVPMPAGMIDHQRKDTHHADKTKDDTNARPTAKGAWRIAGHLAFFDSVTGLLLRTGNMRLNTVDIDTDPTQPRFTASGYFYVE